LANVFSIDVEEWFHLLDNPATPVRDSWESQESRVRANMEALLLELDRRQVRCTAFVLGWIARRHPALVRAIADAGHEIASHGDAHHLVYAQTPEEFRADLRAASDAIYRACGERPRGFRAPGFSITRDTPWALEILSEEGYAYDSSIFPASRRHGGFPGASPLPSILPTGLVEFPVSTVDLYLTRLAYLGGGYLRLIPKAVLLRLARSQAAAGTPLILYLHPRDVDPGQPRLSQPPLLYFRSYVGLTGCMDKVSALLDQLRWTSFREMLPEVVSGSVRVG
jgi:polysaccharide deacetylase family protein (PEP-CTERM system associated)